MSDTTSLHRVREQADLATAALRRIDEALAGSIPVLNAMKDELSGSTSPEEEGLRSRLAEIQEEARRIKEQLRPFDRAKEDKRSRYTTQLRLVTDQRKTREAILAAARPIWQQTVTLGQGGALTGPAIVWVDPTQKHETSIMD